MKRQTLFLVLPVLLLLAAVVVAQTGGGYDLSWSTVDGGGTTWSTGSSYAVGGTVGQPDAGAQRGGTYTVTGGFWHTGMSAQYDVYLPLVLRQYP